MVEGMPVDPDEIAAGVIAAKEVLATVTYMGVSVGPRVTDEEYNRIVTAIVVAVEDYRSGQSL